MLSKKDQLYKNKIKKESTFGKKKCCFGGKKSSKKKSVKTAPKRVKTYILKELLDRTITIRLSDSEVTKRVTWIKETFGYCQVCGSFYNPDYPHHALDGNSRKDDRTMIDICTVCHSHIHTKGFDGLAKAREEVEAIGWENNEKYLRSIN